MNKSIIKAQTNEDIRIKDKIAHQITLDEYDELNSKNELEFE
ncbi:hypothetical protein [Spiroplasma endosymbiont of Labia minor]